MDDCDQKLDYVPQEKIRDWLIDQDKTSLVNSYIKNCMSDKLGKFKSGRDYGGLALDFEALRNDPSNKVYDDNRSFFNVLCEWSSNRVNSIDIFGDRYVSEKNGNDILKLQLNYQPNMLNCLDFLAKSQLDFFAPGTKLETIDQKWHLFVSVFAYSLICEHIIPSDTGTPWSWQRSDIFWSKRIMAIQYPPLRVWMIENAEVSCNLTDGEIAETLSKNISSDDVKYADRLISDCFKFIFFGTPFDWRVKTLKQYKKELQSTEEKLEPLCLQVHNKMLTQRSVQLVTIGTLDTGGKNRYFLKLNRGNHELDVFTSTTEQHARDIYPIRSDFDTSSYHFYELLKSIPCRFGGEGKTQTPQGIFRIQNVTKDEYVSGYRQGIPEVKLFGHLDIFEDYFIHSEMYTMDATIDTFRSMKSISSDDTHTAGCIRVAQDDLDWLIANIPVGTTIEM